MTDTPAVILDASVIAKWYLPDEDCLAESLALRSLYNDGKISIVVPDIVRYEVANALSVAGRRKRIGPDGARRAMVDFLSWDFTYVGTEQLLLAAVDACQRFDCAFYDAMYLSLAEILSADFVTDDRALLRKANQTTRLATWLGEYVGQQES